MCCLYTHGGEPWDKATIVCVCVCTLVLLDPSVFTQVNCMCAYNIIHGNCKAPIVITVHVHTQEEFNVYVEGI